MSLRQAEQQNLWAGLANSRFPALLTGVYTDTAHWQGKLVVATKLTTCTQPDLTIPLPANWLTYVLTSVLRVPV